MKTPYARAVQFFYRYAGWSRDPKIETVRQAKMRNARELAHAERDGFSSGLWAEWTPEREHPRDVFGPGHYANVPHWHCAIKDLNGQTLASLGMIDSEPGSTYARIVQAELLAEALKTNGGQGHKVATTRL